MLLLAARPSAAAQEKIENRVFGGQPERGAALIRTYACEASHVIPAIRGSRGIVGPPLDDVARRAFIAGQMPNRPAELVRWLRSPPMIAPETAMPDMGISEQEAKDIAPYRYSLTEVRR